MMTGSHDALFVCLSILIAVLASYTALDLSNRVRASTGGFRTLWLSAAAMVLGGGIWSMHFVAMLAFRMPGMTGSYDPGLTMTSLVLSVGFTGVGFAVMERGGNRPKLGIAGLLMGLGIVAMHYVGMAAMRMGADLSYDPLWVAISVLVAIGASVAALSLMGQARRLPTRAAAALLMGFAISGMHYAGMRAAIFTVLPHDAAMGGYATVSQSSLAAGVTFLTLLILCIGLGAATLDRRLSHAARREGRIALRLRLADAMRDVGTDEALRETTALMGVHFGVSRVGYGEFDAAQDKFIYRICWTNGTVPPLQGSYPADAFAAGIVARLKAGQTVVIDDLVKAKGLDIDVGVDPGTRAMLIVPFLHGGQLRNIVYLDSRASRHWTQDEVRFLEEIADRARQLIARAEAEQGLRELNETLEQRVLAEVSERRVLAAVVDNTSASVMVCDPDLNILALNTAQSRDFARIYGRACKAGDNLLALLAEFPEHRALIHAQWQRALRGEAFVIVDEFGDVAYEQAHYEVHFHPMRDASGAITGAFLTAYDVSERVRAQRDLEMAQEALRQSQKMEAMGQLTGGVAHDFNNLLTPILGALDMLQRRGTGTEREQRLIAGAFQSADKARVLVQRLLAFARRQPLQPVPVDIGGLIPAMADLVRSTIGPQINVVVDVPDNLPFALADPNQLEMALLNLSVNARDAMPNGGLLRIAARAQRLLRGNEQLDAGRYICLSVIDSGVGMDKATMARAIEPFFSTKGIGRGTGLGLSMAHGLASQLGGALKIKSRPGVGTTVELWLPQSDAPVERSEPLPHQSGLLEPGTVLLVDDEDQVRLATADMLHELGYVVVEACCAEEALDVVGSGRAFDLLLTDHLMPGMTGTELAQQMRSARPDLPVLVISGYAEARGVEVDIPRLAKPFRRDELAASLAKL
ncbi:MAG TPA: MHYT domain-containing protein [Sphingobium sp.]